MKIPDIKGHYGPYGGKYVPETLMPALEELEKAYSIAKKDKGFQEELGYYLHHYAGRPTPLYFAKRLTDYFGGARIYLKREDLCHTGAHKINNTLGQVLLATRMGKTRIIAETGAGQHGVATATAAAMFGLECQVYMGVEDIHRQSLNVFRMKLLGAKVTPVEAGSQTLKDAMNEAIRDWVTTVQNTHYVIGSVAGPHPYPMMVRDFQAIIGEETKSQLMAQEGKGPDCLLACVGGGSNAMGLFYCFLEDESIPMVGIEAGGYGIDTGKHAAPLCHGSIGVLHGSKSYLLQDEHGQVKIAHSVSAGLDYPGVGPEHSFLRDSGRVRYEVVTDQEALEAFQLCSEQEGIIPALESAHALAYLKNLAPTLDRNKIIVVCLSGRGDKDVQHVAEILEECHESH